jgi:outer membrane protein OmpA-like peptidoglycan-associated protein
MMSLTRNRLKFSLACAALAAAVALPAGLGFAAEPSADDIVKALQRPKATRSLTTSPADAARTGEETKFLHGLRNKPSRSLTTDERDKIAAIAKSRPSIDLEITFDYNSANIGSKATPQVTALGQALTSSELKGRTFILAGHTDAKGGDSYNQALSERRADAVKRFLSQKYGIEVTHLVTVGYGKTQLKNAESPLSAENRRVQVVNATD